MGKLATIVVALTSLAFGCLADATVPCGDLRCPVGDVCSAGGCASADAVASCVGLDDGDGCATRTIESGACHGGACRPIACGDGVVDRGEVCDDGNTVGGDGCSADCRSDETCGNDIVDLIVGEQCDSGLRGLSNDGCSSQCQLEALGWSDVTPQPIAGRAGEGLAFDRARNRAVLFGGYDLFDYVGDTWEYDGKGWRLRPTITAPSPRSDALMVYEPMSDRTLLFGGWNGFASADTWEWDGSTWVELQPAHSPPARAYAGAAYDADRGVIVMFGGYNGSTSFADTWEWDGSDWTELTLGTAPSARIGPVMAYDAALQLTVLYGGLGGSKDTWTWDGTKWQLTGAIGPNEDYLGGLAYDPTVQVVVLFGGIELSGGAVAETWQFNGIAWTHPTPATSPTPRYDAPLVTDTNDQTILLFGGIASDVDGDTWQWDGTTWALGVDTPRELPARAAPSMAYESRRGTIVAFGGQSPTDITLADTWVWDRNEWSLAAPGPSARFEAAMSYDSARDRTVLFGGTTGSPSPRTDTWEWDGATWTLLAPATSPSGRYDAAMTFDAKRSAMLLFGGRSGNAYAADLWSWDGVTWTQLAVGGPAPRAGARIVYDIFRDRTVLFGGYDASTSYDDTWEWDGSAWTQVSPTASPSAREGVQLVYDPDRRRVVLYGGQNSLFYDDVWEWDGTSWTQLTPQSTAHERSYGGAVYDAIGRRVIVVGGYGIVGVFDDNVALAYATSTTQSERCVLATEDADGDGLAGCADPDCWGRCAPLCPPGLPCDPSTPHCGDGTCDPVEDAFICPSDCP